ncbi:putative pectinesterase/pectinesterase inhibitor 28 [Mercurialis annua]|uniref:putative pectinesterase/pectinesterase inhibitor 28 n=1 Tax=Mercurialis annua TaxID=3986 RepID=UPI00215F4DE8|nr:putative pectinesterase/pectinesterase inhibitor 28 [Mercurialis annua]
MTYGYDNGSAADGAARKKKFAIIGVSSIILVAMVVAVAVGVNDGKEKTVGAAGGSAAGDISTSTKSIDSICQPTDYKQTCKDSLTKAAGNTSDPHKLVQAGFEVAIDSLKVAIANSSTLKEVAKDPMAKQALDSCKELMDTAISDLKTSFQQVGDFEISKMDEYVANLKIWLSATITYQQTCLDGFENTTGPAGQKMKDILKTSSQLTSNGLAMVSGLSSILQDLDLSGLTGRKLLEQGDDLFPVWLSPAKKRLLAQTPATLKPNIIVAKDGSGQFKTINEAIKKTAKSSPTTFVIYVKAGVYKESVTISRAMTNILLIGDGPTKTKITGDLSFAGGITTIKTATVSISGSNFMAKDIGFENTAGPEGHQAVALRVQSDMSVFYNCQIDGFQDTLYAHTYRQFYRDCSISGTIDIIIGDAAAVFQNCKIVVRKPLEDQRCFVAAQGRNDTRQPTGFVLQNCTISGAKDYLPVKVDNPAFLGRPWKEFSRTIVMQSQIDDIIDPTGWAPWMGTYGINTCSFSEFGNRGPGAKLNGRVTWKGIVKINAQDAENFTPGKFLQGDKWIPAKGVPYSGGMLKV